MTLDVVFTRWSWWMMAGDCCGEEEIGELDEERDRRRTILSKVLVIVICEDLAKEEEIALPNGIRYYELRIGGGATPKPGDLLLIDLKGSVKDSGEVFVDTFGKNKKSLALLMGSRPYTKGVCEGIEYVLKTMKAGGKRKVIVPPNLGYCENGADFGSDISIPPCSTLEYIVEVDKVSIAPA
ncbi:Peptidyl-prolyl cis-trans isomerase FKBP17-2 chloroplastic [Bienertia sinuspersici]